MIKPDQPIKSAKEDLLGRASFSQAFARALLSYEHKTSIVSAIYGNWGSGKSSVINMVLEHIEELTKDLRKGSKPIIFQFNPWNYTDQTQLISQFFKALSFVLKREDYGSQAEKIGEKLEAYSNFFTPLALISALTLGPWPSLLSKIFGGVGKAAKSWGAAYTRDLGAAKNELNKLLEKQGSKIIIVIDDIDRLNNEEIRQIFQLVKILGDGEIDRPLTVKADKFTATAKAKIEAAGGTIEEVANEASAD